MIPANTEVTCPVCATEFIIEFDTLEGEIIECDNCDVELELVNGDLKPVDEDIYHEEDDLEEEDD